MTSTEPPGVSVAIWTCDHEQFINEAIESVLEQDYPRLEVIVADDHSRDNTPRIIADWAEHSGIVKPIYNRGERSVIGNVNRALGACTGDFVAILDGDDAFLPGKIRVQVEAMIANPEVVLCHHPVEVIDESGAVLEVGDMCPDLVSARFEDLVVRGKFTYTPSSMMRRSAMPVGGVPPIVERTPDWVLALEVASHGLILRLPEILARYRVHPGQLTAPVPGQDFLYQEGMRTLAWVEAQHPELHASCRRGRRSLAVWDAWRRRPSDDLAWRAAGIRAGASPRAAESASRSNVAGPSSPTGRKVVWPQRPPLARIIRSKTMRLLHGR